MEYFVKNMNVQIFYKSLEKVRSFSALKILIAGEMIFLTHYNNLVRLEYKLLCRDKICS